MLAAWLSAAAGPVSGQTAPPVGRVTCTRRLMGVAWQVTLHGPPAEAAAAAAAALDEVARLERILSDYDPESELSRLSAAAPTGRPVPLSPPLAEVLSRAVAIRDASDGAFDPTVGPLTALWRQARRSGRLPSAERLAAARAAVGPATLVVQGATAMLLRPGMRLDLGGIGMGYAIDRALERIAALGIEAALIDASGDVGASAPPPEADGWSVAVAPLDPRGLAGAGETIRLAHAAVTTSGDAFQAVEIGGQRYSHIVDPRTGIGVAGPAAVTVIAPDCTTADAVATAASVLGPDAGRAFVARLPGCAAAFRWEERGSLRRATTAGWPALALRSGAPR